MLRKRIGLLVCLTLLVGVTTGNAEILLNANLTNDQENPPAVPVDRPASSGFGTFVLNDAMTALVYNVTVFNIDFTGDQTPDTDNDDLVVAHIHRAPRGENGPVIFGFIGGPFNETDPNDVVVTPFATGVGGTVTGKWDLNEGNNTTLGAEIANILANNTYINFHTVGFPGGEVRGQLVVPEPSSIVLLGGAAVGLIGFRRLRRMRSR